MHQGSAYLKTPRIGSPFCNAKDLLISSTAPAPSLTWLELPGKISYKELIFYDHFDGSQKNKKFSLRIMHGPNLLMINRCVAHVENQIPAVVVPSFLNTAFNFAKPDTVVSGRIPSSIEIVTCFSSPLLGSMIYR